MLARMSDLGRPETQVISNFDFHLLQTLIQTYFVIQWTNVDSGDWKSFLEGLDLETEGPPLSVE